MIVEVMFSPTAYIYGKKSVKKILHTLNFTGSKIGQSDILIDFLPIPPLEFKAKELV